MFHKITCFAFLWMLSATAAFAQIGASLVECIITDLNQDTHPDTIRLWRDVDFEDPGVFTHLSIHPAHGKIQIFRANTSYDTLDLGSKRPNSVASKLIFIEKSQDCSFLLCFGYCYGSGREELMVIKTGDTDSKIVYQSTSDQEIQDIVDLDHDGSLELVIRPQFEEHIKDLPDGSTVAIYCPFVILRIDTGMEDKVLSEKYNREHYVYLPNGGYVQYKKGHSKPTKY